MKDFIFPSCFNQNGVQVADSSCYTSSTITSVSKTKPTQNLVTCVYQCKLLNKSSLIIINWTKNNIMGHSFSIELKHPSHKHVVHIKPSMFSKRKGSKTVHVGFDTFDVNWDLTDAEFRSSPEPVHNFFVGLVFNGDMVLLIGDMRKTENKSLLNSMCLLKREHVFGGKVYGTKAKFKDDGRVHDIEIEYDVFGLDDVWLVVRLDGKVVMQVKHLVWKFRGNDKILVDGVYVEVYWDVHDWLFGSINGSAVFMFRTCLVDGASVDMSWSLGFCLTLYAWKNA